jgi:hypothetical protein
MWYAGSRSRIGGSHRSELLAASDRFWGMQRWTDVDGAPIGSKMVHPAGI